MSNYRTIRELMNLNGKCALVTGATGGIGKQIATTIAELGGDIIATDKPGSNYSTLLKMIDNTSESKVIVVDCDLEDEMDRNNLLETLISSNKNIDILINNAAFVGESNLTGWVEEFESQSIDTWRRAIEVNLTAPFHLSQGLYPKLKSNGGGSIINIASIYAINAPDYSLYKGTDMGNPAAYSASKGGLVQLTRWLSTTLSPDIRINSVSPGGVYRNQSNKFVKRYEDCTPLKRMAYESDLNGSIAFLASDLSVYVTGQNLVVDGGWTA